MKIRNRTPLAVMSFRSVDLEDKPFQVVIAKGTFEIVPSAKCELAQAQAPIRTAGETWRGSETPRFEDDLAPFKPCTDVVVNATAHAPGGKPLAQWRAGIRLGELKKRVLVTGPRAWVYTPLLGWSLSPVVPVRSVPLRYERAFGGRILRGDQTLVYDKNPVGQGFVDLHNIDRAKEVLAPQILSEDGRLPVFGEAYPVEGLGAIAKAWQPRRARMGTIDEAWAAQERPKLPKDFHGSYWNAAHPDLVCDEFLRGGEEVRLENLHPEHAELSFPLPALVVAAAIVDRDSYRYGTVARLDTVWIDAEAMRVELTWRATLPLYQHGIARIDVAMREREEGAARRAA